MVPPGKQVSADLCNQTINIQSNTVYLASAGWWVYTLGLIPCIRGMVLNKGQGFCVIVQLIPNLKYYKETQMVLALSPIPARAKQAIGQELSYSFPGSAGHSWGNRVGHLSLNSSG